MQFDELIRKEHSLRKYLKEVENGSYGVDYQGNYHQSFIKLSEFINTSESGLSESRELLLNVYPSNAFTLTIKEEFAVELVSAVHHWYETCDL